MRSLQFKIESFLLFCHTNNKNGIIYQVLNGKNGMPAFGERLTENEIENVAEYVLIAAEKNFEF